MIAWRDADRHRPDEARTPSVSFVGRKDELALLRELLDGSRPTRAALIEGEAGIGKTALVGQVVELAEERGVRCLRASCYEHSKDVPLSPFLEILARLTPATSPLDLVKSAAPDKRLAPSDGLAAVSHRGRFLSALAVLVLDAVGQTRTLLCIEDVHWADLSSLLVLHALIGMGGNNLTLVATRRTDEDIGDDTLAPIQRYAQESLTITLPGLGTDEVAHLLHAVVPTVRFSQDEVASLQSWTRGNPLLLCELTRHIQGTGLLNRHRLPEAIVRWCTSRRLGSVVDLRLRSLPSATREAVSACAVWGQEFSLSLGALLMDEPEQIVEDALEEAVDRDILEADGRLDEPGYRFRHPLFQKRLYDLLSRRERRKGHRKITELAASGSITAAPDHLARHYAFGLGRNGGRIAVETCMTAAEEAEAVFAHETAARHWEHAIRCAPLRARRARAELHRRLGESLMAAGEWTRAAEAWRTAVQLLDAMGDMPAVAPLALGLAEMHRWRAQLDECETWASRALSLRLTTGQRARALALLGSVRCLRRQPQDGLRLLEEAHGLARSGGGDPFVAYWLSYGYGTTGQLDRAYAAAREGFRIAKRTGTSNFVALLAGDLVFYDLTRLQFSKARLHARLMGRSCDAVSLTALVRKLICEAWIDAYEGRWDHIVDLCERWLADVRLASRFQIATARMFLAEAELMLGNAAGAKREIMTALPDLDQMRTLAALHLARACIRLGDLDRACELLHTSWRQVARDRRHAGLAARALLGEVSSHLDEPRLWRLCYRLLAHEQAPLAVMYAPISLQRVLGRLAGRMRDWPAAVRHFETAIAQLDQGGARWELAQTCLDFAQMRRARRRRADQQKAEALQARASALLETLGVNVQPEFPPSAPIGLNRFGLTGRELEVLELVAEGRRNHEIAEALTLSLRTVHRHLENILAKMGVSTRTEAVVQAVADGLAGPLARAREGGGAAFNGGPFPRARVVSAAKDGRSLPPVRSGS